MSYRDTRPYSIIAKDLEGREHVVYRASTEDEAKTALLFAGLSRYTTPGTARIQQNRKDAP